MDTDLGQRSDPDAWRMTDMVDQLAKAREARRPTDELWVKREGRDPSGRRDAFELRQPALEHRPRSLDRALAREEKERRVVEHPRDRNLDEGAAVDRRMKIGHEAIHHVRRVVEALGREE